MPFSCLFFHLGCVKKKNDLKICLWGPNPGQKESMVQSRGSFKCFRPGSKTTADGTVYSDTQKCPIASPGSRFSENDPTGLAQGYSARAVAVGPIGAFASLQSVQQGGLVVLSHHEVGWFQCFFSAKKVKVTSVQAKSQDDFIHVL